MGGRVGSRWAGRHGVWTCVAVWLCLGFMPSVVRAGAAQPLFLSHLQMADGLSHGDALAVLQDRQGFIWVATESGLNRYDGQQVKIYRRGAPGSEGLDADFINALAEDPAGDLWLATAGGGLVRWDRRTDRFTAFRHNPMQANSIASDALQTVWSAPDGTLWVGTESQGLEHFDPRSGQAQHFRAASANLAALPDDGVFVTVPAARGQLWVGTDHGLALFELSTGRVLRRYDDTTRPALPDVQIRSLYREADGSLWIGTFRGGLALLSADGTRTQRFRPNAAVPTALASDNVRAIVRDRGGRLWIGTSLGLDLLRADGTFQHYAHRADDIRGLPDSFVMSLYEDPAGLLWIGTRSAGVSRWNPRSWQMGHFRPRLASGLPITSFAGGTDPHETLVGTVGGGLLGIDLNSGVERTVLDTRSGLPDNRVMALLRDRRGDLWIGTLAGGLVRQNGHTGRLALFHAGSGRRDGLPVDGVMSLFEDRDGQVWAGTFGGGLCRYLPESQGFACVSDQGVNGHRLSDARVTAIAQDSSGRLWIGTPGGGLNCFDSLTGQVHIFRRNGLGEERAGLSDDRIYALQVDAAGILWVGSAAGGLMRVVPPAKGSHSPLSVHSYGVADGLPSNVIYGIEPGDGDELWLSTANGLVRFSRSRGLQERYNEAQGLQGADFNFGAHHRFADGVLAFGGLGGLNHFQPSQVKPGNRPPPVVLTAFEVLNKPAHMEVPPYLLKKAVLGYRDVVVSFEFAALDYVSPQENRYDYRLEGFDADWISSDRRHRVSYTNLAAGDYVFHVRARSADGVLTTHPLTLPLTVQPAPWASPMAYAVYALLMLGGWGYAVWLFRRKRERELQYNRRLERTVYERTDELEERNRALQQLTATRSAFVARMSHELRTPMNGVIGIADLLLDTPLDDTQRRFTKSIQQSADSLVKIVSNILDFSKMEADGVRLDPVPASLNLLVEQVVELFAGTAAEKGLELVCASPAVSLPEVFVDEVRFRQIVINLVGNAVKFTDAGHVQVSLTVGLSGDDDYMHVMLRIDDTGVGIREANLAHIFDAFQQEDNSTTRRFGGSGLGLTIAHQLVELMGGRLSVVSRHGEGSCFSVMLKLSRVAPEWEPAPLPPLDGLREVFIIEPNRSARESVLQWLSNWGVRATGAASWAEISAERLAATTREDVFLGGESTWLAGTGTVVESWRHRPLDARPRCVLLSGFGHRKGMPPSALNAALFSAHLVKPLRWRELQQALSRFSDGRETVRAMIEPKAIDAVLVVSLTVLVVDDHALNRTIAVGKLAALGHRAHAVASGREALEAVAQGHFDLVLMDCQMPEMDGYATAQALRLFEVGGVVRIPIIALTADATSESRARCLAAGMDDFMEKPFAREELAEKLAIWCPAR